MKATIFVFSLFIIGCLANEGVKGKCPDIESTKNVEAVKMIGRWNSIYESKVTQPCVAYEFEQTNDHHFLGYFLHRKAVASFAPIDQNEHSGVWKVSAKFNPKIDGLNIGTFATDYDHYNGFYACKEVGDKYFLDWELWSRNYTLSDEAFKTMKDIIAKTGLFDVSKLNKVKHENCGY